MAGILEQTDKLKGLMTEEEELVTEDIKVCDMCEGTGEVDTYYRGDDTGYNYVSDGSRPCICQLQEEEFNDQD